MKSGAKRTSCTSNGFTLVELSLVLVVIGLIVGGVMAGKDLIEAAKLRSVVSQLQSYQVATNTFRLKYNALPGDIKAAHASQFGLAPRSGAQGRGDGNRIVERRINYAHDNRGRNPVQGEQGLFWRDLSETGLIGETFTTATDSTDAPTISTQGNPLWDHYLPTTKVYQNRFYVWSGGLGGSDGVNYFGLSVPTSSTGGWFYSQERLTNAQAAQLDAKLDDGLHLGGKVTAMYISHSPQRASGGPLNYGSGPAAGTPTPASWSSCYDNDNNAALPMHYTLDFRGAKPQQFTGYNCALSSEMQ